MATRTGHCKICNTVGTYYVKKDKTTTCRKCTKQTSEEYWKELEEKVNIEEEAIYKEMEEG